MLIINILRSFVLIVTFTILTTCLSYSQVSPVKPKPANHSPAKPLPKKPATPAVKKDTTHHVQPGVIIIEQDSGIDYILNNYPMPVEAKRTVTGYRIQVLATTSRQLANDTKAKVMDKFPDLRASLVYQQPYFKLRIGDFKTRLEATYFMQQVTPLYTGAFIVKDKIRIKQ